jgi:hypothetical protein
VPYTYKSLAFLWLTIFGLVALTASGTLAHSWLPVLLLAALIAPRLILRSPDPVGVVARSRQRPRVVSDAGERLPWEVSGIDVYRWENEGGAAAWKAP